MLTLNKQIQAWSGLTKTSWNIAKEYFYTRLDFTNLHTSTHLRNTLKILKIQDDNVVLNCGGNIKKVLLLCASYSPPPNTPLVKNMHEYKSLTVMLMWQDTATKKEKEIKKLRSLSHASISLPPRLHATINSCMEKLTSASAAIKEGWSLSNFADRLLHWLFSKEISCILEKILL